MVHLYTRLKTTIARLVRALVDVKIHRPTTPDVEIVTPTPSTLEDAPAVTIGTCLPRGAEHWIESHAWRARTADLSCRDCGMRFSQGQERPGRRPTAEA